MSGSMWWRIAYGDACEGVRCTNRGTSHRLPQPAPARSPSARREMATPPRPAGCLRPACFAPPPHDPRRRCGLGLRPAAHRLRGPEADIISTVTSTPLEAATDSAMSPEGVPPDAPRLPPPRLASLPQALRRATGRPTSSSASADADREASPTTSPTRVKGSTCRGRRKPLRVLACSC